MANTNTREGRNQEGRSGRLTRNRVHQSLVRTPLYAGVEKGFLLFEVSTVGFLFFVVGFRLVTFVDAAVWVLVLHPLMAWVSARDPLLPALYIRSLTAKDYYAPNAAHRRKPTSPKPSVPKR
jgi:type IV secretory pathway TrbD component